MTLKPGGAASSPTTDLGALHDAPDADRRAAFRAAIDANRDRWGRPLVVPPGGGKPRGYRRASSFGSPLEYEGGLTSWKMRQVARGVSRSEVLQLETSRAEIEVDGDPGSEATKAAKRELDDIAQRAMDEVGSGDKARIGTAMHAVYERHDLGLDPGRVLPAFAPDFAAYRAMTEGVFRTVSAEEFVVEDEFEVAGTYDRCLELLVSLTPLFVGPDGKVHEAEPIPAGDVIIGDVKTSQSLDFAGPKFAAQGREYAFGHPYDPVQGKRIPWAHRPPRQDFAIILHVPSGQGVASMHWINLAEASVACAQARESYAWCGKRGKGLITKAAHVERREDFRVSAASAADLDELTAAAKRAVVAGEWNDELRVVFTAAKVALVGGPVAVPA